MVPVFGSRHADCFYVGMGTGYTAKANTKDVEPTSPKSPLPSTDTTPTKAVEPAYPISPLPVSANTNTTAATLMELMDWRNQNSVSFAWSEEHSSYWVIPQDEHKLTPAIAAAIREQQVFVKAIAVLPTNDTPSREMSEEEFFSSLREACLGKK